MLLLHTAHFLNIIQLYYLDAGVYAAVSILSQSISLLHIILTLFVIDNLSDLQGPICLQQTVM